MRALNCILTESWAEVAKQARLDVVPPSAFATRDRVLYGADEILARSRFRNRPQGRQRWLGLTPTASRKSVAKLMSSNASVDGSGVSLIVRAP